jgi:hypothetical protein
VTSVDKDANQEGEAIVLMRTLSTSMV